MNNLQEKKWTESFGVEYTERNTWEPDYINKHYRKEYGISREEMNFRFLGGLNLFDKKILEVGCNVGNQLNLLQSMGYKNLYGIEIQPHAIEKAKNNTNGINIIYGSGSDIPFKDKYFDMVFTSGVLIHIAPENLSSVIKEIYRCSNKYIWGFEYYNASHIEIKYRGNENLLWKGDFSKAYKENCTDLVLTKEEFFKYTSNDNEDVMFLLKKNE